MDTHIKRGMENLSKEFLGEIQILKITGSRQTGKSTLAKSILADMPEAKYVSMDDAQIRASAIRDPYAFVRSAPDSTMVIDEVQRLPEITLAVKEKVDTDKRPGQFILTGSSDFARVRGFKDSLAGRNLAMRIYPLTQQEIHDTLDRGTFIDRCLSGEIFDQSYDNHTIARAELAEMIVRGGYPGVFSKSERYRNTWFDSHLEDVIGFDIEEVIELRQPERLHKLFRILCAQQMHEIVPAKLAREAGIPESSVQNYLDALRRSYILEQIPAWQNNLTSREISRHKGMIIDPGIVARTIRQSEQKLADTTVYNPLLGFALEGLIALELLAQERWSVSGYSLYHWRDRNQKEVDFVVECDDERVIAIEVKSGEPRGQHFNTLEFMRDKLGDRFLHGFVVTPSARFASYGDRLSALPLRALWV